MTEALSPFVPGTHKQHSWDSTSLGWAKTCPRLYQYQMVLGLRARAIDINKDLFFGQVFHSALETYDKQTAKGISHEKATEFAVDHALRTTWLGDSDSGGPWESGDSNKNRESLIRAVIWYLEHWANDAAKTLILKDGRPAVELSFQMDAGFSMSLGQDIIFCGHLDRVVEYQGMLLIQDRKTTKSTLSPHFFDKFTPDNQMSLYILAGRVIFNIQVVGVMIDGVQTLVGSTNFARGFAMRSEAMLEEWRRDAQITITKMWEYADANYWPMNDSACDKYGGCRFRKICSRSPEVRDNFLKTDFEINPWNPLIPR